MSSTTVRVNEETRALLRELALETGQSMRQVLTEAVERYRRQRILERSNAAYAALSADPEQWADELAEREGWDAPVADRSSGL